MDYFSDLDFVCAGSLMNRNLWNKGRYFDGYFGLQYIHKGRLLVQVNDGQMETLLAPAAFITFPGARWHYGPSPEQEVEHSWLCFQGERVQRYLKSGLLALKVSDVGIPIREGDHFHLLLKTAIRLFQQGQDNPILHGKMVLLLEELLLEASEANLALQERDVLSLHGNRIHALMDKLSANPEHPWDFPKEAQRLSLSYVHFRKLFRQISGLPPGQFLRRCRLKKAETLLATTEERCGEVAQHSGFPDQAQFCRIFRQKYSFSPLEYRKRFAGFRME